MENVLKSEITDQNTFLSISIHLTGFTALELLSTGLLPFYYYTLTKEPDQECIKRFFVEAQSILKEAAGDDALIGQAISKCLLAGNAYNQLAQRIILLWYTGVWTSIGTTTPATTQVLSAASFMEGLVWKAAQTHPAGAKQPGFASWADPAIQL